MTSEGVVTADLRLKGEQVKDDKSKDINDDVRFGEPDDSRKGRAYKKSNWTPAEMLVLQAARRDDFDRQNKGELKEKKTAVERWQWIEDYCWAQGVQKSAQQCQDKWELLVSEFKKVNDYEKKIPHGQRSYWEMLGDERKRHRLPRNFYKEVFQALTEWYNKSKVADPGELAVDTSTPVPVLRSDTGAGGSPGSDGEFSDSEGNDAENTNGLMILRKRKLLPKLSVRMAPIVQRNNKNVVDAIMESDKLKDKRHREDMEMEKMKFKFEKERFRDTLELGNGYIIALNNIGEGLKHLSAALQAARQL